MVVTARAHRGSLVLGLRLPVAESDAWLWAGRLLLVVAGTAVAWFLLLMMSGGQARAETPPVLPCFATTAAEATHPAPSAGAVAALPPVAVECPSLPSGGEQGTPASVPVGRSSGIAGAPAARAAVDQAEAAVIGAVIPADTGAATGNHGHAVVGALIAAGTIADAAVDAAPGLSGPAPTPSPADGWVQATSGHLASRSRTTTADGPAVAVAHSVPAVPDAVLQAGRQPAAAGAAQACPAASPTDGSGPAGCGPVRVGSGVHPSTEPRSPRDAGVPPLPTPPPPAPCADTSMTTLSGSGGSDRFQMPATLGTRDHPVLPTGSTGRAPLRDGAALGGQARPEPRPD